ncbi:hypothetical protein JIG36_37305 [Actinoplanes sp. LDG1-06]|uniref:EF-hand domain-containing protein n=1 Tax=Paractinoplanes ovalisporus TaxID=2810368 RepID=A0ABS2AN21_9ACTN|nr:hypothetical protein [Actinoplanes ovalisporus]MBM2621175.1 hypothetical protein [Actinoplanes ovalisporus]
MARNDGYEDLGAWSEFGTVSGMVAGRTSENLVTDVHTGFGDRPDALDLDGLPDVTLGASVAQAAIDLAPPEGYDNTVDADGDGTDDAAVYLGRADGGVDILVDADGDGRVDFVGTDTDLDNRVDYADYDKDRDGVFEKRMFDDDGDGFLDRSEWLHGGS